MMGSGHAYDEALVRRPVLHTSRLVLRRPTEKDVPAINAIAGDWENTSRLARMPHPYSEKNARFFLNEIVPAELTWSIIETSTGSMVGVIGLARCEQVVDGSELGYYIARTH